MLSLLLNISIIGSFSCLCCTIRRSPAGATFSHKLEAAAAAGPEWTTLARLIPRLGERGLAIGGGLLLGASFATVLIGPGWAWSVVATFALGLGFYMLHNTLQVHATQMAPRARGTAVSLFAAAMYLAQSIGITLASAVVDRAGAAWLFAGAAIALPLVGAGFARLIRARRA